MKKIISHSFIGLVTCFLLGLLVTKAASRNIGGNQRDNNLFITTSFWNLNPSTGDIYAALYSTGESGNIEQSIYTKNRKTWNTGTDCTRESMYFSGPLAYIPATLEQNTIYSIASGSYSSPSSISFSGNCIAIVGSGKVYSSGTFNLSGTKYSIIDNIYTSQNSVNTNDYQSGSTGIITLQTSLSVGYEITGSSITTKTGTLGTSTLITGFIVGGTEGEKNIITSMRTGDIFINHFETKSILDRTQPTFSAKTAENISVISGQTYKTGIIITFYDNNLSGARVAPYPDSYFSGELVSDEGQYKFFVEDKAGNSTGISFNIDTTLPVCSTMSPTSGSYLTADNIVFSWNCSDNFAGISGYIFTLKDSLGNTIYTTGIENTVTNINIIGENNLYKRNLAVTDKAGNIYTGNELPFSFYRPMAVNIGGTGNIYGNIYYTNTSGVKILLSGNKQFTYVYTGDTTTLDVKSYNSGIQQDTIILSGNKGINAIKIRYQTGSQSGESNIVNYYFDQENPIITGLAQNIIYGITQTDISFSRTVNDTGTIAYTLVYLGTDTIYSGSATSFFKTGITNGAYTRKVRSYDRAGNNTLSETKSFTVNNARPAISGVTNNTYYTTGVTPIISNADSILLNGYAYTSGTVITGENTYTLIATNSIGSTGITFTIDKTAPAISLTSPVSGTTITGSNSITFSRNGSDTNISGYYLIINGPSSYTTGITTTLSQITLSGLFNGTYTWQIQAVDKAGNTSGSNSNSFTVSTPLIASVQLTGINYIPYTYYSSGNIGIIITTNKFATGNITGDIGGNILNTAIQGGTTGMNITLTGGDGNKNIYVQLLSDTQITGFLLNVMLDTISPSQPVFSTQFSNSTGTFTLGWNASDGTGSGIKEYTYTINNTGNNIIKSGTTTSTSVTINNMELYPDGIYYANVKAKDNVGKESVRSTGMTFTYAGIPDTIPDSFNFNERTNASLERSYKSNTVIITGLSQNTSTIATTDNGVLYINGSEIGRTGAVRNGYIVQVELFSSDQYDDTVKALVTIGTKTSTYEITTMQEDSNNNINDDIGDIITISSSKKLQVSVLFHILSDLYSDSKQNEFMTTLKAMVKSRIQEMQDNNEDSSAIGTLQYLYQLIDDEYQNSDVLYYTAPNGKSYTITYENGKGYTSPNFIIKGKYFLSISEIKSYIEKNNKIIGSPTSNYSQYDIDSQRSSSNYKAPNGKIYRLFKTIDEKYGSYDFIFQKVFSTLAELKTYIYKNNTK